MVGIQLHYEPIEVEETVAETGAETVVETVVKDTVDNDDGNPLPLPTQPLPAVQPPLPPLLAETP